MAMRSPFVVRALRTADAEAVRALARSLGPWFNAEGLQRMGEDLASHAGFVAMRGDQVLGFVLWSRIDAAVADLSWMGVAEERQHQGIGGALLATLVADLAARGYRSLEVSTVADSMDYAPYAKTRRFYRSHGFTDFRVDAQYWGSGDDRYDRLVLRRDLGTRP